MIYFLKRADGLIKIGVTTNYYHRYSQLKSEHGALILLGWQDGNIATEQDLHKRFADYRVEKEWFKSEYILTQYIAQDTNHAVPPRTIEKQSATIMPLYSKSNVIDKPFGSPVAPPPQSIKKETIEMLRDLADEVRTTIQHERDLRIKAEAQVEVLQNMLREAQEELFQLKYLNSKTA